MNDIPAREATVRSCNTSVRTQTLLAGALAALALVVSSVACTFVEETHEDSFTGPGLSLVVEVRNGAVELTSVPGETISVRARIMDAERVQYQAVQEGDIVRVSAEAAQRGWTLFRGGPGVSLVVTAPPGTPLQVTTSNGLLDVEGFTAGGTLRTSNGNVSMIGVMGDYGVRTSNGRILINRAAGSFDLETSNGNIDFNGELVAEAANRLWTSNGSVTVSLIGEPSLRLEASTSNGRINVNLPIETTVNDDRRIVGVIGGGAAELLVRTSNGSVTIE